MTRRIGPETQTKPHEKVARVDSRQVSASSKRIRMPPPADYVLGQDPAAARRLEIQDRQFAGPSERLLDALAVRPNDRVVELGCGPGGLTRRILRRLGRDG